MPGMDGLEHCRYMDMTSHHFHETPLPINYGISTECRAAFDDDCPVCGDKVSGYHYGLLTCESCKGFFKRTVQNKKIYSCIDNQGCIVDKIQRKRCPFCRFQKCLKVGMKLEAVRADRMRGGRNKFGPMYKRDRALKLQKQAFQRQFMYDKKMVDTDSLFNICCYPCDYSFKTNDCNRINKQWENLGSQFSVLPSQEVQVKSEPIPRLITEMLKYEPPESYIQSRILSFMQVHQLTSYDGSLNYLVTACKVAEQLLFFIVDWARSTLFFKDLQVEDQMKLLQNCWSELLVLDHVYRQIENGQLPRKFMYTITGQSVDIHLLHYIGLGDVVYKLCDVIERFRLLEVDRNEFVCLKFMLLLNPDTKDLANSTCIEGFQEQIHAALLDYTITNSSNVGNKFSKLMTLLPELKYIALQGEDFLQLKHINGEVPFNSLLMEMLYSKHR